MRENRRSGAGMGSLQGFVARCCCALEATYNAARVATEAGKAEVYSESVRSLVGMLAVLVAGESIPAAASASKSLKTAAQAAIDAASNQGNSSYKVYESACREARASSGLAIFHVSNSPTAFDAAAHALLQPMPDAPIPTIYFQTMPLSWLGCAYQSLLALRPSATGEILERNRTWRKDAGVYFSPPSLVNYIIESAVEPIANSVLCALDTRAPIERIANLRVMDPSMGGGDFLCRTVEHVCGRMTLPNSDESQHLRASIASECVYGVDIDPLAVEISRFCVWAASGYADGLADALNTHLLCANALGSNDGQFDWHAAFPKVFADTTAPGFHAVVGNPPYIACKNGLDFSPARSTKGQPDAYLMFLSTAMDNSLVKPGGMLSMVLPDPMLVRANAASIRRRLMSDWTVVSILHISGAFPDAGVANAVPVFKNAKSSGGTFQAARIERAGDRKSFLQRPARTAGDAAHSVRSETVLSQPRCEFLYLLEEGPFGDIIRRIHGENASLAEYQPPFTPLRSLNVKSVYRGEEIGKAAISRETGEERILLGGQSIQPYEIEWEGRRTDRSRVVKPIERYHSSKILIQKSSARLIAALDIVTPSHPGYVFPQSVYGIELRQPGIDEHFLLCILNSQVMNEYIRRTVTGYKLVQPQLEIEDIRALPVRRIEFTTPYIEREIEVEHGLEIFERESLRADHASQFPELTNFAAGCLTGNPERSDVVHDLLVHLGKMVIDLTARSHTSPGPDTTQRLESARAAVEALVWRLYSSEPAQMALTW
ncbi:MAG: TaqI-like C-terminal specificity domain-containing protein [Armatimonadota bacterium]|nr:N-6 DNA methylase [bacterium]